MRLKARPIRRAELREQRISPIFTLQTTPRNYLKEDTNTKKYIPADVTTPVPPHVPVLRWFWVGGGIMSRTWRLVQNENNITTFNHTRCVILSI